MRINDTVHYVAHGSADGRYPRTCRAAIVTHPNDDVTISLCVLNPTGLFFHEAISLDTKDEPDGGTWHGSENCPLGN